MIETLEQQFGREAAKYGLQIRDYPSKWKAACRMAFKAVSQPERTCFATACRYFVELGGESLHKFLIFR